MQGNQTKSDARPAVAVLTYTPNRACLPYQGVHCPATALCQLQPMATTSKLLNNLQVKTLDFSKITCIVVLRLQGPI